MNPSAQSIIDEADRCVACGLCLPHCPTYRKTGSEADSPRGRIQLMRAVALDILPNNPRFKQHIDLCLGCRSCESACPNTIHYGALLDQTRAVLTPKKNLWQTLAKPLMRSHALQYFATGLLWLTQQCGLRPLLQRALPRTKLFPKVAPPVVWKSHYPAKNSTQGAVSLFLGCASNGLDQATLKASIYVLNQLGWDVHIPHQQTCCGSIARAQGDATEANQFIERNQHAFSSQRPILTVASGCGAGLHDYLPQHNVQDIHAFLAHCDWSSVHMAELPQTIYVQDPCSLRHGQKSHTAVYALLKKIPAANILPLAGNSQCCGGAGAYMLTQQAMAQRLREDKLIALQTHAVAVLATANIGCALHLAHGAREKNLATHILHPVQIIAQQMGFTGQI